MRTKAQEEAWAMICKYLEQDCREPKLRSDPSFRVGIHAECYWDADENDYGRPTLHCVDCGEAWVHGGIDDLVIVWGGDGWCGAHGVPMSEAHDEEVQS